MLVNKLIKVVNNLKVEQYDIGKQFLEAKRELKRQLKKGADCSKQQRELAILEAKYQAYLEIYVQLDKCFS